MKAFILMMTFLSLVGCATKKDKQEIQDKVANEPITDSKSLGLTIKDLIQSSKTFTDAQKKELEVIMMANKKKAEELTEESYKSRSVLIKELLTGKIDKKKVSLLKKNIKRLEDAKLKNTFETVEKITAIVANHPEDKEFAEHLMIFDRPSRSNR
ncbi:MAG: hypothetical protein ACOVP4_03745 [Bacteriovoracaceae bacterium]|jgi:hypothetical protein